jgi:hypothetical protein
VSLVKIKVVKVESIKLTLCRASVDTCVVDS